MLAKGVARVLLVLSAVLTLITALAVSAPGAGAATVQKQCAKTAADGIPGVTFEACVWNEVGSHLVYGSANTYVNGDGLAWLHLHGDELASRYYLCSPSQQVECLIAPHDDGWNCLSYLTKVGRYTCTATPGIRYRGNSTNDQTWWVYGGWALEDTQSHVDTSTIRTHG